MLGEEAKKKTVFIDPELKKRLAGLYGYMSKRLGIKGAPKIYLTHNSANSKKPFGLTGYYNPEAKAIKIYTTNRHPTDILRSFAHEMIHHWQNEKGTLTPAKQNEGHEHYAQKDPNLRKREMEAYLLGNIVFRDWQDEQRYGPLTSLNENLEITDPKKLQEILRQTIKDMIRMQIIRSIHRQATSGDMNPEDFTDEMARKLELELNKFIQVTNNKSNWESQPNMIKECKKCGCKFEYRKLKEVGMGYTKCPGCNCNMDQEGNTLRDG